MKPSFSHAATLALVALLATGAQPCRAAASAAEEVRAVEQAFADTMAQRDFAAFQTFLSAEAVFFSDADTARGKDAVAERWAAYFEAESPPFSWAPGRVEVLDSGNLALSTGPVYLPDGRRVSTFNSVWRREPDGKWRIVFDKGDHYCAPGKP